MEDDPKLDIIIIKIKQQYARIFTQAIQRQAKGGLKNIKVIIDPKAKADPDGFLTVTALRYGIFQDLGTGKNPGNPNATQMYAEAKSQTSRFAPPRARKFSKGNLGGIKASFYQSIPANLFDRYADAITKALLTYTQQTLQEIFP